MKLVIISPLWTNSLNFLKIVCSHIKVDVLPMCTFQQLANDQSINFNTSDLWTSCISSYKRTVALALALCPVQKPDPLLHSLLVMWASRGLPSSQRGVGNEQSVTQYLQYLPALPAAFSEEEAAPKPWSKSTDKRAFLENGQRAWSQAPSVRVRINSATAQWMRQQFYEN